MKLIKLNQKTIAFSIYFFGVFFWVSFLNYGSPKLQYFDWPITKNLYLTIKFSLIEKKIPYFVFLFPEEHFNFKFFANGIYAISPQILLIKFLDLKTFINFNILFFFSIGFYSTYLISKHFKFNNFQTTIFLLLINFNGYISSKIAVGHLGSSNAIFMIPTFYVLLLKIYNGQNIKQRICNCIFFSLFIFFCKLNSNGHQIEQFLMIGFIYFLIFNKRIYDYLLSLIIIFFLIFYYIYPTLLYSNYLADREIFSGYSHPYELFSSLTKIFNSGYDAQWEKNIFIGYTAFIFLFFNSIAIIIKKLKKKNFLLNLNEFKFFFINLIIFILSLYLFKNFIYNILENILTINIPKVDRLPTRLIIYPLYFYIFINCHLLKSTNKNNFFYFILILAIFFELNLNSISWIVSISETHYPNYPNMYYPDGIEPIIIEPTLFDLNNNNYINDVKFSFLVSLLTLIFCFITLIVLKFKKNKLKL